MYVRNAPNVPVLMYHHVTAAGGLIAVTPQVFEQQIKSLARAGYSALTAAQFAAYLQGGKVPEKSVLITFDDGYLNNWTHAYPILQRYGMHAVVFLITDLIGDGPVRPHVGQCGAIPGTPGHADSLDLIAQGRADDVMLRWSEIQCMQADGTMEFHSHTHTHQRWHELHPSDTVERNRQVATDIETSRQVLLSRQGAVSDHFCWPEGHFDEDYVRLAREAGFHHMYTTDALGQNTPGMNTEHIFRVPVRNKGGSWLRRRLWLARHPVWGPRHHAWKAWKKRLRSRK